MTRTILLGALLACMAAPAAQAGPAAFETLDGRALAASALPGGRLLLFWHPDCSYCLTELAALAHADADLLAHTTTIALLPAQNVRRGAYALPPVALSLASRANPLDILEQFGNPDGTLPYALVTRSDGSPCRQLNGEQGLADFRQALASCR